MFTYSFTIAMPGVMSNISYFDDFSEYCLKLLNYPRLDEISLAIHEAVINAVSAHEIKYGIENNKDIRVEFKGNKEQLEVKVIDVGGGIPHDELVKLLEKETVDLFAERGRGILFMKHFSDDFQIGTMKNGEFCVTLIFYNRINVKCKIL